MENYSQTKLEFKKVLELLSDCAFSNFGRTESLKLEPVANPGEELKNTREMIHLMFQEGEPPIGGIFDIRDEIDKARAGDVLEPLELLKVKNTVLGMQTLREWFSKLEEPYAYLGAVIDEMIELPVFVKKVEHAVNDIGEIKDSASDRLRQIRVEKRRILNTLKNKLDSYITSKFSSNLQQASYFMRDGRYVLPIKSTSRSNINGIIHSTSSSGGTYYMEPEALVELNDKSREIQDREIEEINRILRELSMYVLNNIKQFDRSITALVKFDLLWAKAKYALKYGGIVPELSSDSDFNLLNVRHPLLGERCVPITVSIGLQKQGIVITGPNTGGKTVTLKTIGLAHLMALCGMPILASRGSRVGNVSRILADIGDEQSIEQSLSTFSGHLRNITEIVNKADERTLVLLDELGAGTDPVEGAALALGLLEVLLEKKVKLIVTSHLTPLKIYCYGNQRLLNASVSFDIETLSPTYKLRVGLAGSSNAFDIAKRLGVPDAVLISAEKFKNEEYGNVDEVLNSLHDEKQKLEDEKQRAEDIRRELETKEEKMQDKLEKIRKQKIEGFMEDIDELEEYIASLKKEAEQTVSKLKMGKQKSLTDVRETNRDLEAMKNRKLGEFKEKLKMASKSVGITDPDSIKPGDWVKIKGTDVAMEVVEKKSGKLIVQNGILKVEVDPGNLEMAGESEIPDREREQKYVFYNMGSQTATYNSNRLDIRGHTVEEGVDKLKLFLENLILHNHKTGYIVHGKGTGKLAEGIWDYLNSNGRVSSFRIGKPKEGGTGVTVIELY
ncbi:MAG TPA: endonuclease MutS2 [Thermotogota bacterium]|nr:endonuclease MutS2 [Thermotogota bacterium]HPJ87928.1 endonuclease MutS2 [Thermotogota bacterium]HPR95021.1 endonuclease MutS2 [Thermotogota bacterium]